MVKFIQELTLIAPGRNVICDVFISVKNINICINDVMLKNTTQCEDTKNWYIIYKIDFF